MSDLLHVQLDAVGGAAGDMFVAAMLDALPELRNRVMADLAAVMPKDCGTPVLSRGTSQGMAVLRFGLADAPAAGASGHHHDHDHHHHDDHDHRHDHHHHGDDQAGPSHDHPAHAHPAGVTTFPALSERIAAAAMSPGTAAQAVAILRRLAEAESRVHDQPLDQVHFHEVGDWDSLMDVVAAGSIIAALPEATWSVSPLPRGGGLVRTQHGLLPVPAPATAEILKGFAWRDDGVGGERVTPTGAAIIAHLVGSKGGALGAAGLAAIGTGAGTRDLGGLPNILRALVFRREGAGESILVLSFDVDDMTGEEIGLAQERLRALAGVLDLTVGGRMGKKGRPVSDFRLLVRTDALDQVCSACFEETTTIGLRWHLEQRQCLPRDATLRRVGDHVLPVKQVRRPGGQTTRKVESDSLVPYGNLAERRRMRGLAERDEEPS